MTVRPLRVEGIDRVFVRFCGALPGLADSVADGVGGGGDAERGAGHGGGLLVGGAEPGQQDR